MRPISPHLMIYKKQISSVLSILHRISGAILFGSMCLLVWYFVFLIYSNFSPCALSLAEHVMVKLILFIMSLAVFYHLCTGIRHLFWDMGLGFSLPAMHKTGYLAVTCCLVFTLLFWFFIV